jgi:signal transduction histidine kinase
MRRDSAHAVVRKGLLSLLETTNWTNASVVDDTDDPKHAPAAVAGTSRPLGVIASDRPFPEVLHALGGFFEAAAVDWKRREAELRRSEAFLAQAQRLTKTGSLWWKPSTGEVTWSEENYRIMGYPVGITPTVAMAMDRCHPDDLALVAEQLNAAIRDGTAVDFEHRLLLPDGTVKHVRVLFQNVASGSDEPEFIGAATDITDWKNAEDERRQSEARQRQSEETLGALRSELAHVARVASLGAVTASIVHEVNQPLSGVITNASTCLRLLATDPPDVDGARETARRAIRDGNRASEVISRLRALFAGKPLMIEPVDINEATREVLALSRSELQRTRATVRLELAVNLPPLMANRVQLQQVIINLLRNASEATRGMDDQRREVVLTTAPDGEDRVRLSVRDSGAGFGPHGHEKIFDAFYTTKSDGMGIGLSVSRSIIESHGGRLWAISNAGPGVTFSFSIPYEPQELTYAGRKSISR